MPADEVKVLMSSSAVVSCEHDDAKGRPQWSIQLRGVGSV